jgi:hypothetical protein
MQALIGGAGGGESRAMFSIRSSLLEPKSWSSKEDAENVTKIARKFPNFIVWVLQDQENKNFFLNI